MPRLSHLQELQDRAVFLSEFQHDEMIWFIAQQPEVLLRPIEEMRDVNGDPTFLFMKECHDRFIDLTCASARYRETLARVTHYGAFAEAVLLARHTRRSDYAQYFDYPPGPDHPRVTEMIRLMRRTGCSASQAARTVQHRSYTYINRQQEEGAY